jgi:hypothetical protein
MAVSRESIALPQEAEAGRASVEQSAPVVTDDALISRWIEPDPHKGSKAEYRVAGRGVQVWALAAYFRTADGPSPEFLNDAARAYEIPIEAAQAAFDFYRRHQSVIDDRMDANAA